MARASLSFLLAVCLFVFGRPAQASDQNSLRYDFQPGEPLAYKLEMTVTAVAVMDTRVFGDSEPSRDQNTMTLNFDYQFMPIIQREDSVWKTRVVPDEVSQVVNHNGEIKKKTLDRSQMRRLPSLNEPVRGGLGDDVLSRYLAFNLTSSATTNAPPPPTTHAPEQLFDEPILAGIMPDGTLREFEDRTELQQAMPGVNLKKCFELILVPLSGAQASEGAVWTRDVPLDLPSEPLAGSRTEPTQWRLSYRLEKLERVDGWPCARISVSGHCSRTGLSIPIRKETIKYLTWTTFVSRIEDQIHGIYVFDLEHKVVRSSSLESVYSYETFAGRKEDNFRGQIKGQNTIRTEWVNKLVSTPPVASVAGGPTDSTRLPQRPP